jgi:predicted MPP superfamily phosphohydrolase
LQTRNQACRTLYKNTEKEPGSSGIIGTIQVKTSRYIIGASKLTDRLIFSLLRTAWSSLIGAGVVGFTNLVVSKNNTDWVEVSHFDLQLPRLAPEFDGYRLVHISDFHIGTWMDRERLEEAVTLVNHQHPDLIAITGDLVTYHPNKHADDLVTAMRHLRASDGTLAVLGNHDHWTDAAEVRKLLRQSGTIDLSNEVYSLRRGEAQLHFAGVDDYMFHMDRLDIVLDKLPDEGAAILLAHEPDFADVSAASNRFDLQLSGHTHGGQIRFPVIGPPYLPRYGKKYSLGMYQVGEMIQYTNRGLGTGELPIRLNCQAEITVFTLRAPVN